MNQRLMENMTLKEVGETIEQGCPVIVPLGITEQHGFHLPLSTDSYNTYEVAKRAAAKTEVVVAPPLHYSYSGAVLTGTINVDPHILSLFVAEICKSLYAQGFKAILLLLGHGGTELKGALNEQAKIVLRDDPLYKDNILALAGVWEFSPTWLASFAKHDYHAAEVETSVMLYWAPHMVRDRAEWVRDDEPLATELVKNPDNYFTEKKKIDDPKIIPHINQRPDMKVGVMGDPAKASAELGKKVSDEAVAGLVEFINKIRQA
jgi:creatinine amidohydrolase